MDQTVELARKEQVMYSLKKRLGKQSARRMQRLEVLSCSGIPLSGHYVEAGKPQAIDVLLEDVAAIEAMVEDSALIEQAKASYEGEVLKSLRDAGITPGTAEADEHRRIIPNSWQATFTRKNDRSPNCMEYVKRIGEPFMGHPDDLHVDPDGDADKSKLAEMIAAAVAGALAAQAQSVDALVAKRVDEALAKMTAPSQAKR